jgi:magnesium-transporting ATPase (P-type)
MLTGDKLETAENIGHSCRLLTKNMEVIKCSNLDDIKRNFNAHKARENELKMR